MFQDIDLNQFAIAVENHINSLTDDELVNNFIDTRNNPIPGIETAGIQTTHPVVTVFSQDDIDNLLANAGELDVINIPPYSDLSAVNHLGDGIHEILIGDNCILPSNEISVKIKDREKRYPPLMEGCIIGNNCRGGLYASLNNCICEGQISFYPQHGDDRESGIVSINHCTIDTIDTASVILSKGSTTKVVSHADSLLLEGSLVGDVYVANDIGLHGNSTLINTMPGIAKNVDIKNSANLIAGGMISSCRFRVDGDSYGDKLVIGDIAGDLFNLSHVSSHNPEEIHAKILAEITHQSMNQDPNIQIQRGLSVEVLEGNVRINSMENDVSYSLKEDSLSM